MLIALGAAAFLSVGRNPLAGIAAAFAGVAAGFGVNFLITPLDGVLTEITNDASALADPDAHIDLAANLFFGIASALFVTILLTFVTAKFVEGRIGPYDPADAGAEPDDAVVEVEPEAEAKGLRYALWATLGVVLVIALLTAVPGAPLQDPETGRVIGDSPFMDSLIVIIALIFLAAGLAYGHGAGTLKGIPLIVVFVKRYQKHAGIGTVVSLMIPYVLILSVGWTLFFVVWYLLGIPLGPGSPVHP